MGEVRFAELQGGDVDEDLGVGKTWDGPGHSLAAGLAEDPVADGKDEAGIFSERDELVGWDHAERWMLPTQEGFKAVDLAAGVEERLVHQVELIVLERGLERGLAGGELAHLLAEVRAEDLQAGFTFFFAKSSAVSACWTRSYGVSA